MEKVVVVDAVERRCQIRVQYLPAAGSAALGRPVDRRDCVLTAAAGPEAVRFRLEPRFPLRLQCLTDPGLLDPVQDHGDAEWAFLAAWFGDVHPLDWPGRAWARPMLDPVGQFRNKEKTKAPKELRPIPALRSVWPSSDKGFLCN